jgi:hypothetical protein
VTTGQRSASSPASPDYREGIKKDVAEVKFLIHDLRVEGFVNEILHYHVTLNTDLEIYNITQAQVLHAADVQELKAKLTSRSTTSRRRRFCTLRTSRN